MAPKFAKSSKFTFYGFNLENYFDYPFLTHNDHVCAYVQGEGDLKELSHGVDTKKVDFYSDNSSLELLPLSSFDPNKYSLMVVSRPIPESVENFLSKLSRAEKAYFGIADIHRKSKPTQTECIISFRRMALQVLPSVEIPSYFTNWAYVNFLVDWIEEHKCENVIDMFSGAGAIGFSLSRETTAFVDLADVNVHAVHSMRKTQASYDLISTNIVLTECFSALRAFEKKYDLIVGNPPHMDMPISMTEGINGRDPDFQIHNQFYNQAASFINDNGKIIIIENAFSGVLDKYYPYLPSQLVLEKVIRSKDRFWDIIIIGKA